MRVESTQLRVRDWLEEHEIFPMSIVWTYEFGGLLAITFWVNSDLDEFLSLLEYGKKCDKSGYDIFRENNTINISGIALMDLIIKRNEQ